MRRLLRFERFVILILVVVFSFTLTACSNTSSDKPINNTIEQFNELQSKVNEERAMSVIQYLMDVSPRVAGTNGEEASAKYILEEFNKLGFKSNLEEFPMKSFKANQWNLKIHNGNDTFQLESNCFSFSSSTPNDGLKNFTLINGILGLSSDVKDIDMQGKIAVVKRGEITFKEKVDNCANRGAEAVVIINSDDAPLNATLLEKSPIPAVSVSLSEGMKIINAMNKESLKADLLVDTTIENSISNNIIGIKESNNKDAKTLIIGAHYDSVDCPGANDNASGVGGLMELAYVLKDYSLPFNIRFIAFGSEEIGLIGSNYNVYNNISISKNKNIIGMINMDMIGMGEHLSIAKEKSYTNNSIYNLASKVARELNLKTTNEYLGRSDHVSFEAAGIPVVFLTYRPYDPMYYHTKKDTIDTIDSKLIKNTVEVVLKMVIELANEK